MSDLISREEVLNLIDTAFESGAFDGRYAYENLIDAVQNLVHPLETDLISRQAVLDLFAEKCDAVRPYHEVWQAVKEFPSVEPERKPGKWQKVYAETDYQYGWIEFTCENCGHQHGLESGEYGWYFGEPIPWKYCPMCGAPMEVDG